MRCDERDGGKSEQHACKNAEGRCQGEVAAAFCDVGQDRSTAVFADPAALLPAIEIARQSLLVGRPHLNPLNLIRFIYPPQAFVPA